MWRLGHCRKYLDITGIRMLIQVARIVGKQHSQDGSNQLSYIARSCSYKRFKIRAYRNDDGKAQRLSNFLFFYYNVIKHKAHLVY